MIRFSALCLLLAPLLAFGGKNPASLDEIIRSEEKPEKRSEKALEYGDDILDDARKAYRNGNFTETEAGLREVQAAVDLSFESLKATGDHPRRKPKHFKRAEKKTRNLLRRLDTFRNEMSYLERDTINAVHKRIEFVHDELLRGIMTKKDDPWP